MPSPIASPCFDFLEDEGLHAAVLIIQEGKNCLLNRWVGGWVGGWVNDPYLSSLSLFSY